MPNDVLPLILAAAAFGLIVCAILLFGDRRSLDGIKSRTVGDGQHGTARWATPDEIRRAFHRVPFRPDLWRRGESRPGVKRIAADLRLSRRTAQRALADLERAGYLKRDGRYRANGSRTSNLYTIAQPSGAEYAHHLSRGPRHGDAP